MRRAASFRPHCETHRSVVGRFADNTEGGAGLPGRPVETMNAENNCQQTPAASREGQAAEGQGTTGPAGKPRSGRDRFIKGCFLAAVLIAAVIVYMLQRAGPRFGADWSKDLTAALDQASREERPVLAYFIEYSSAQEVQDTARTLRIGHNPKAIADARLIKVRVKTQMGSDLAGKYGLTRLPAMAVLSPQGRICKLATGPIGQEHFRVRFLEPELEGQGWLRGNPENFDLVIRNAAQAKQPVLTLFTLTPSSGDARRMAFTTLADTAAEELMRRGGFVRVVVRVEDARDELATKHGITQFPTLLLIAPDGRRTTRTGFLGLKDFREFLASVSAGPR